MKRVFACFFMLTFICPTAQAGLFGDGVNFEDLSYLSPQALETLKDAEFKVFLAEVNLGGAKVLEKRTKEHFKAANHTYDSKNILLKTARKDFKATGSSPDQAKRTSAEKGLADAQKNFDTARALIEWKEKEVSVREAGVKKAKAALELAEAERDFARASKLIAEKAPSAGKYNLLNFKKAVVKRQKEHTTAIKKEEKEILEANKLREDYEKLSEQ